MVVPLPHAIAAGALGFQQGGFSTKVRHPVPGEDTLHSDKNIRSVRLNGFEKGFRIGFHITMQNDFTLRINDTEIHHPGVKIDSAVILMCSSIESHWGLLLWLELVLHQHIKLI